MSLLTISLRLTNYSYLLGTGFRGPVGGIVVGDVLVLWDVVESGDELSVKVESDDEPRGKTQHKLMCFSSMNSLEKRKNSSNLYSTIQYSTCVLYTFAALD